MNKTNLKVRWTIEEDTIIERLYRHKKTVTEIQAQLKHRTVSAIYGRVHTLELKRPKKLAAIVTADFSSKLSKRALEQNTSALIDQKGGWVGIPGPAIVEHFKTFEKILRADSPFIAVEENSMQYNKMVQSIEEYKRIKLIKGELFDILRSYTKVTPRVPLFSYAHLDFCKTTTVLIREYNLLENLVWLSKWEQLKSTFYLDVSLSRRPDGTNMYSSFLQHTIPLIFKAAGWQVTDPRKLDTAFMFRYRDGNPMVNALYKFEK